MTDDFQDLFEIVARGLDQLLDDYIECQTGPPWKGLPRYYSDASAALGGIRSMVESLKPSQYEWVFDD